MSHTTRVPDLEFLDLLDAPTEAGGYSGFGSYFVAVKSDETGLEFVAQTDAGFLDTVPLDAPSPANGQILAYNSTSGAWEAVDHSHSTFVLKAGDTMTGLLTLSGDPTNDLHAATKQYVDAGGADPAPPTNLSLTENGDKVDISFDKSVDSDVDAYELWTSIDGQVSFKIIGSWPTDLIPGTSNITFEDGTYSVKTTVYYRVYAIRNGNFSSALTGNIALSDDVQDVDGLTVTTIPPGAFYIAWKNPDDSRLDYVEIKVHADAVEGNLSEGSATVAWRGTEESYLYQIAAGDEAKYHKFWVYTITRE